MKKIANIGLVAFAFLVAPNAFVNAIPRSDNTTTLARTNLLSAANKPRALAERGDARSQTRLGFMYEHGRGVPPDYGAAVYWYSCAAEQGHATAQYLLGLMYDKGHGTTRSNVLAYKWLSLAAAHAHPGVREHYLRIRDAVGGPN